MEQAKKPIDILIKAKDKGILVSSKLLPLKTTRTSQGSTIYKLKDKEKVTDAILYDEQMQRNPVKCRKIKVPAPGSSIY